MLINALDEDADGSLSVAPSACGQRAGATLRQGHHRGKRFDRSRDLFMA